MNNALISILGGLGGMFGWGASDFFANHASDRVGHTKTFFWSQVAGLLLVLFIIIVARPALAVPFNLLLLTALSGVAYGAGYLLFYKGFEIGNVSVVSAVINMQIPFVMFISFFWRGQSISFSQLIGLALLLSGVLLVSVNFKDLARKEIALLKGVKETLISAVIFGVFYWPVNEIIVEQAHWLPVTLITKLAALFFVWGLSLFQERRLGLGKVSRRLMAIIAIMGILEALAVLSVSVGLTYGDAIIVTPISSALTLVTVSLAVIFLKERLSHQQKVGIGLAIFGIILTAL